MQAINNFTASLLAGALVTVALPVYAADGSWTGTENDYWDEPHNWSPWLDSTDTAVFDKGDQAYTVTYFNQGVSDAVGAIKIVSDDVTLDLNQVTLTTNSTMSGLNIFSNYAYNNTDSPSLTLLNGTLATNGISLGQEDEGDATLTVSTGASIQGVNNAPDINLGNGQLNIINGGEVNSRGINNNSYYGSGGNPRNAINVSGAGSKLINSGEIRLDGWELLSVANGGSVQTNNLNIGYAPPVDSLNDSISIDGANSNLTTTGKLVLINAVDSYADAGPTRLSVTNGATVTAHEVSVGAPQDNCHLYSCDEPAGSAAIMIDGAEFTHTGNMDMGGDSVSTVTVSNGGTLNSLGQISIGGRNHYSDNSGKGTVTITGSGSSWNVTGEGVELSGPSDSEINILDGASASIIGSNGFGMGLSYGAGSDSTLKVDGAGSSFTTADNYDINIAEGAGDATSMINVSNGGSVELQAHINIGIARYGNAEINVSGTNSTLHLNSQDIRVARYDGTADINVSDGGKLQIADSSSGAFRLGNGYRDEGDGTVTLDITNGSELNAGNTTVVLGGDIEGEADDVIMTVTDSTVTASDIEVNANATLIVENSTLDTSVSIIGGSVQMNNVQGTGYNNIDIFVANNGFFGGSGSINYLDVGYSGTGGTVSVGNSPGHLTVDAGYTQYADGTLIMELGGYAQGTEYDFLEVLSGADLDGTLQVELLNGFNPLVGSEFELISASWFSEGSGFSTLILPELNGPKFFEVAYDSQSMYLTVAVPIPASVWLFGSGLALLGLRKRRALI